MSKSNYIRKTLAAAVVALALFGASAAPAEAVSNRANGVRANGVTYSTAANGV